jgi:hypothetical protein
VGILPFPRSALGTRSVFMRAPPTRLVPPGPHRHTGRGGTGIGYCASLAALAGVSMSDASCCVSSLLCAMCASARALEVGDGNGGDGREGVRRRACESSWRSAHKDRACAECAARSERIPTMTVPPRDLRAEPARLAGPPPHPPRAGQRPPRSRLPTEDPRPRQQRRPEASLQPCQRAR